MKNFRLNVIIRISLAVAFGFGAVFFYRDTPFWLVSGWMCLLFAFALAETIRFVERSDREVSNFLLAIKQNDFTNNYPSGNKASKIHGALHLITSAFIEIRNEKESNFHFLKTIVEHSGVPLLAYDVSEEEVTLVNKSFKDLLALPHLTKLSSIDRIDPQLTSTIRELKNGERVLIKAKLNNESVHLSVTAREMSMQGHLSKVISLHNIDAELDQKEVESWQKLIRVMTHEIKNSVIPISTLAEVISDMVAPLDEEQSLDTLTQEDKEDLVISIKTIEKRSKGLVKFVTNYGDLAKVPKPQFELVDINELIEGIAQFEQKHLDALGIELIVDIPTRRVELSVDPEMIEQVLINLVKNAIEAIQESGTQEGKISIKLAKLPTEIVITIADNGGGMNEEVLEQIFTPFYTTKTEGSGIGLSYGKQIMRSHKGNLRAYSSSGKGSTFEMSFWHF